MRQGKDIVDFHSHILPNADHGSSSTKTSLYQLNSALSNGVKRIIATPHFYPHVHTVEAYLSRRDAAFAGLKPFLEGLPEIRLGAEVLICKEIENLPSLDKLFVYGTNTLLLELPFTDFEIEYCDSVYAMVSRGINVVLAHADRYHAENIEQMIECGAKIQLNTSSLVGLFKNRNLYNWMERGLVVALGSDIHQRDSSAYSGFSRAIDKIGDYADYIKSESDKIWNSSFPY